MKIVFPGMNSGSIELSAPKGQHESVASSAVAVLLAYRAQLGTKSGDSQPPPSSPSSPLKIEVGLPEDLLLTLHYAAGQTRWGACTPADRKEQSPRGAVPLAQIEVPFGKAYLLELPMNTQEEQLHRFFSSILFAEARFPKPSQPS